jgi:putative transposase
MKQDYSAIGIAVLCGLFGKTRHAYYDNQWRVADTGLQEDIVIQMVLEHRQSLPMLGTRKLYEILLPSLRSHEIKMGRDHLFELLDKHNLLIRRRKRKALTTDSHHWMHKYMNLTEGLNVLRPEQLWVSDITYIRLTCRWGYLSLITDAYSRKIMGYSFRTDLTAQGCLDALEMALNARQHRESSVIHHSDRGCQYCSKAYVDMLVANKISISMTENGDPYENAIAERINGIIKTEFTLHYSEVSYEDTYEHIHRSIKAYNALRPHSSCDYLTPDNAHMKTGVLKKRWKNYRKDTVKQNKQQ